MIETRATFMWIFTTVGFFSIVQKPGAASLTVRARVGEDLDRLREQFMPELGKTMLDKGTDYSARAQIGREDLARGLAKIARAIRYPNFKNEVRRVMGEARKDLYDGVWLHLRDAEEGAWSVPPTA